MLTGKIISSENNKYEIKDKIGNGSYGVVYEVIKISENLTER